MAKRKAPEPVGTERQHSNAYNIFILVLTLLSLGLMFFGLLPLDPEVVSTIRAYDNLICFVFLADFAFNLTGSRPRRLYFVHRRGWLDLLGSIPTFGFVPYAGLIRLFRISRLFRIGRILGGQNKKQLLGDLVHNRSQYAFVLTALMIIVVLSISSVLVLQFELASPEANITTGGDAIWWAIVTITTVGYGDHYPVTPLGRIDGVFVMFAGIGVIGALASLLSNLLLAPATAPGDEEEAAETPTDEAEPATAPAPAPAPIAAATTAIPTPATPAAISAAVPTADDLGQTRAELATTRAELAQTRDDLAEVRRQLAALIDRLTPPAPEEPDAA
ncbi:MAG: ion transporter [Chloroflexota bacterium]